MGAISVGIVGVGRMGRLYADFLSHGIPGARLTAISGSTGRDLAEALDIAYYENHMALLKSKNIEMVLVCTRTPSHAELAIAAAQEGKHIFLEKPIALRVEDADQVIEEAHKNRILLTIGFMRRFDPSYRSVRHQIVQGALGMPLSIRGVHRSKLPPDWVLRADEGGGLALDYLVHEYDLARWLLESEVERVYAVGGALVYREKLNSMPGLMDQVAVLMQMKSGATASVEACCAAEYAYDVRTEVLGSKGMATIGSLGKDYVTTYMTGKGSVSSTNLSSGNRFREAFRLQLEEFVSCVSDNRQPLVTGEDGRAALCIGLAVARSLHEGKPVEVML
ncbi:MAG: Gfo/Idh/MocA family oxidoreductase [Firmicutes bacterium]|jgi:predicted dehydrogenase|nr:Gfo/Idh/MocA family oxidoreductase [Bacillota bacterium]